MANKIRNAINGGLVAMALTASSALGNTTNAPVMTEVVFTNSVRYPAGQKVIVAATNLQSSAAMVNYQFERSTNLVDWVKLGSSIDPQSSPTNIVSTFHDMKSSDPYYNKSFYRIYGKEKDL